MQISRNEKNKMKTILKNKKEEKQRVSRLSGKQDGTLSGIVVALLLMIVVQCFVIGFNEKSAAAIPEKLFNSYLLEGTGSSPR